MSKILVDTIEDIARTTEVVGKSIKTNLSPKKILPNLAVTVAKGGEKIQQAAKAFHTDRPRMSDGLAGFKKVDIDQYRDQMKLTYTLPDKTQMDIFTKNLGTGIFSDIKLAGKDENTVGDMIKINPQTPEVHAVCTQITEALAIQAETTKAQKNWQQSIEAVQDIINKGDKPAPLAVAAYLQEEKGLAVKAIKKQQEDEAKAFSKLFEKDEFKQQLISSLGVSEAQLPKIQQEMETALKKSQQDSLKTFEKEVEKSLNECYQKNQAETTRITYLATMYKQDAEMRREIDRLIAEDEEEKKDATNTTIGMNLDTQTIDFSNIDIKKLNVLRTLLGREITKSTEQENTYSMKLPTFGVLGYYQGKNLEIDILSLAQTIRAAGFKGITMKFTYEQDPELALRGGRAQVSACLEAGFKPEDITVEVNGVTYKNAPTEKDRKAGVKTFDELYQNSPSSDRKEFIDRMSKAQEIDFKAANTTPKFENIKAEVNKIKATKAAPAPAPAAPTQ